MLIRMLQESPVQLTSQMVNGVYKPRGFSKLPAVMLNWLLKGYNLWFVLFPFGYIFHVFVPANVVYEIVYISLALLYLFVHIRSNYTISKRPLYWILWALVLQLFWVLTVQCFILFDASMNAVIFYISDSILNLSLLFAFVMSVYFSDLLDPQLILKKTIIYGIIIFLFTFLFGTTEHFIIHQLSHYLHIESVYISSTFACLMGMCFHPLKEKLTHLINHSGRKKEMMNDE